MGIIQSQKRHRTFLLHEPRRRKRPNTATATQTEQQHVPKVCTRSIVTHRMASLAYMSRRAHVYFFSPLRSIIDGGARYFQAISSYSSKKIPPITAVCCCGCYPKIRSFLVLASIILSSCVCGLLSFLWWFCFVMRQQSLSVMSQVSYIIKRASEAYPTNSERYIHLSSLNTLASDR